MTVRVKFWGTRGSIACAGSDTVAFGGNTSCVEVRAGDEIFIFDAGTGARPLGLSLVREGDGKALTVHLFISHTHWDHIQGFPFFTPAYVPGTRLHVYGAPGQGKSLEKVLRGQMDSDYFPVALGDLAASVDFHEFRGEDFRIGETRVSALYLNHPGMALGYRVSCAGTSVVYASDHEPYRHTLDRLGRRGDAGAEFGTELDEDLVRFVAGADLYIGEAQYTDEEYPAKIGWGHSPLSATVGVAVAGDVKSLALFHHDPMHADGDVLVMEQRAQEIAATRRASLRCFAAREGQVLSL